MQMEPEMRKQAGAEKGERGDPSGFVMSVALALFGLTLLAVCTMHLAGRLGWRVL